MAEIILPKIDDDIEESSVIFWHKQEGDKVEKGDVLVEVQTEKAVSEIEAKETGVLKEITVKRGEVAKAGDSLGVIGTEADSSSEGGSPSSSKQQATEGKQQKQEFVRVAPRLRKLAKDLQVDLQAVQQSVKDGKITEKAIRDFAEGGESTPDTSGEKLSGIRKTIADRMKRSLDHTAQLTETAYADVTELAEKRQKDGNTFSWNVLILYATVQALQKHPYMNGTFEHGLWNQSEAIHLGVATDTEEGLIVPTVTNAHEYSMEELSKEVNQLVQSVQEKKVDPAKLSGSTFTVTNLGGFGIHFFTPIINPPEVAILGLGAIEKYVVLEEGNIKERMRLPLSLTFDHQVVDGAPAARFIQTVIDLLANPNKLM